MTEKQGGNLYDRKMRAYQAAMLLMRARLLTPSEAADVFRVTVPEIQLAQLDIEAGNHPDKLEEFDA